MAEDMVERVALAIVNALLYADFRFEPSASLAEARARRGDVIDIVWTPEIMKAVARAAIEAMREPTEEMVRRTLVQTEPSESQFDFAAGVIEGMPPLPPHRQRDGINAAADIVKDWQAGIDAALNQKGVEG